MKRAVLLIHGFAENCETSFSQFLSSVKFRRYDVIKYNILGHDPEDKEEPFDHEKELERINAMCLDLVNNYDEVNIIGFSLGGALAGYLASKYKINKLVMIAPAYKYFHSTELSKMLLSTTKEIIKNKSVKQGIDAFVERKAQNKDSIFYNMKNLEEDSLSAIKNFIQIIDQIKKEIETIECPTLIFHGECDELIPIASSLYIYEKITNPNKMLIVAANSQHRVLSHKDAKQYHKMINKFVRKGRIKWKVNYKKR